MAQTDHRRYGCYPEHLSRFILLLSLASLACAQPSVLLDAMSQELGRNFGVLKQKGDPAPYFMSYEVTEQEYRSVSGSLGAVASTNVRKSRVLDICVRVGSPQLDNYHRVRGVGGQVTPGAPITFEDNVNSIKRRIWLETDRAYRTAAERLIRINTKIPVHRATDCWVSKPGRVWH